MNTAQFFGIVAIGCMLLLATRGLSSRGVPRSKIALLAAVWLGIFAVTTLVIWVVQTAQS